MALTQKEISQLYVALLNRAADAGGVEFWQDQASLAEAAQAMIDSQAGTPFYPEDNRAFVEQIYENTVGLEGQEDADIQYWVDLLASGEYSRGELVAHMVNSIMDSEYEGTPYQESFVSRVAVSEYVAGLNLAGMSPEELVAATTFDEDGLGVVRTEADTTSAKEKAGELEAVDNTSLTEKLEALEAAREAQTEAADALEEKFEALAAEGVTGFSTGTFSTDELEGYELALESAILTAQSTLNTSRQTVATDAQLDTALATAQKIIDEDTGRYNDSGTALYQDGNGALVRIYASTDDLTAAAFTWSTTADTTNSKFVGYALVDPTGVATKDQTTATASISALADGAYTARQIQNFVTSTLSAYEAHVTRNGETADLVADLKDAVALYRAQNADVGTALADLNTAIATFETGIKTTSDEGRTENVALYTAVKVAYDAIYTGGDNSDESTLEDNDRGASLEALLETLEKRDELSDAYDDAVTAFTAVDGALSAGYATAEGNVATREGEIEAVATAQADAEEFAALIEAYNTASDSVTAADEALGYSIEDIDEAVEFGTTEDDLFILDLKSLEASGIDELSILDAAAGDIIYFGSDYTLGTDIEAGDNNATEIFITEVGGNTVVTIETETYGSNTGDVIELTLVGVENVTFEDGVLAIA